MRIKCQQMFWIPQMKLLLCFLHVFLVASRKMHQDLEKMYDISDRHDIIITMDEGIDVPLNEIREDHEYPSRAHKTRHLISTLQNHASKSQKHVHELLERYSHKHEGDVQKLYVTNQIVVRNAERELVEELEKISKVQHIAHDKKIESDAIHPHNAHRELRSSMINADLPQQQNSNLNVPLSMHAPMNLNASYAWKKNIRGEGIIVGHIDTGVLATHETLGVDRLVGWLDAVYKIPHAYDNSFHGTHTAATIIGEKNIGIAPKANIVSCKAFDSGNNSLVSSILLCAQYMMCPDNGACKNTPRVINNSWKLLGLPDSYTANFIAAWERLGIIGVFSAGNNFFASQCRDVKLFGPGSSIKVLTVGAISRNKQLGSYSRQGDLTENPSIKPDISAPGAILSATNTTRDSYQGSVGTSMACAQVTGAIALLLQYGDSLGIDLSFAEIRKAITVSADTNLGTPEIVCNDGISNGFPNSAYGYGLINIGNAMEEVKKISPRTSEFRPIIEPSLTDRLIWIYTHLTNGLSALFKFLNSAERLHYGVSA